MLLTNVKNSISHKVYRTRCTNKIWLMAHEKKVFGYCAQTQTHCNDVNVGLFCPQSLADGLLFVV